MDNSINKTEQTAEIKALIYEIQNIFITKIKPLLETIRQMRPTSDQMTKEEQEIYDSVSFRYQRFQNIIIKMKEVARTNEISNSKDYLQESLRYFVSSVGVLNFDRIQLQEIKIRKANKPNLLESYNDFSEFDNAEMPDFSDML